MNYLIPTSIIVSYLLGAVPFGLVLARLRAGVDLRQTR